MFVHCCPCELLSASQMKNHSMTTRTRKWKTSLIEDLEGDCWWGFVRKHEKREEMGVRSTGAQSPSSVQLSLVDGWQAPWEPVCTPVIVTPLSVGSAAARCEGSDPSSPPPRPRPAILAPRQSATDLCSGTLCLCPLLLAGHVKSRSSTELCC